MIHEMENIDPESFEQQLLVLKTFNADPMVYRKKLAKLVEVAISYDNSMYRHAIRD